MFAEVRFLTVVFDQFGLVVPQVEVRRGTTHEQLDDTPRLRRMVRGVEDATSRRRDRERTVSPEHRRQRDAAEPTAGSP